MVRKIIHIDMDAFYASVEQRDDPALRGKPVAVGFARENRGVVAAASYEARRFGVRSAMSAVLAKRLCPDLVFVTPDFSRYSAVSRQMRAIFAEYTDLIEPLSLDECYLDVTHNKRGVPYAARVAHELRARIREDLGLTASAGVAPVKFVAKIASDHRKPDGLTVITPEHVIPFIHPLPVRKLRGVGPATHRRLHEMGIARVEDLARRDRLEIVSRFGKQGLWLHQQAWGQDPREVTPHRERKSRGAERTFFEDLTSRDDVIDALEGLMMELLADLESLDEQPRCLTLKVRYRGFETITRAHTSAAPFKGFDDARSALDTLLARTEVGARPVRLVGVAFSQFLRPGPQLTLPFAGK